MNSKLFCIKVSSAHFVFQEYMLICLSSNVVFEIIEFEVGFLYVISIRYIFLNYHFFFEAYTLFYAFNECNIKQADAILILQTKIKNLI